MALIHKSEIIIAELYVALKEVKCFQPIKFCVWAIFLLIKAIFSFTLKTILFK